MLDRYWFGATDRISPEAPVPVIHINQNEERPGGSGNVALNIRALQAQVKLVGVVGDDEAADTLEKKLQAAGVNCLLHREANKPTIIKLRVLSQNQQLLRIDFEESFSHSQATSLSQEALSGLDNIDVVIISDYGKGSLKNCQDFILVARERQLPVLVDPKGDDFSIYRGATLITPNYKEFERIVGCCANESELVQKGLQLLQQYQLEALLVTRGSEGMTLLRQGEVELHLPAQSREVYDITGAGDTVIAMIATALAAGADLTMAVALANRAAGIVVAKLGAATVSVPELKRSLVKDADIDTGIMTEQQLLFAVEGARIHSQRIVMTNGCFDILHAGHVAYLERAKALGDRLIVAVNDDASVAELKGPNRPINSLDKRMSVLAGLSAVDWVVSFSEATPERLIGTLLPDYLVKGGDYHVEEIAGHQHVIANGGKVMVLNFEEDCSTTAMIEKIGACQK